MNISSKLTTILMMLTFGIDFSFAQDLSKINSGKYLKNTIRLNSNWKAIPDLIATDSVKGDNSREIKRISKTRRFQFTEKTKTSDVSPRTIQALRNSTKVNERTVVYNEDRKTLGVLTENLLIKVKNPTDLQTVISDHGLLIVRIYENIGRAIVKCDQFENLETIFLKVKEDSRVKSVDYEILTDKVEAH